MRIKALLCAYSTTALQLSAMSRWVILRGGRVAATSKAIVLSRRCSCWTAGKQRLALGRAIAFEEANLRTITLFVPFVLSLTLHSARISNASSVTPARMASRYNHQGMPRDRACVSIGDTSVVAADTTDSPTALLPVPGTLFGRTFTTDVMRASKFTCGAFV